MELSPEEKERIYEEEKARRDALSKIEAEEKQKNSTDEKKKSQICLRIVAILAISWVLYYPTKVILSSIFLSKEDLDSVANIEQINADIDRNKGALWDVGMKDASLSIGYLSYPKAYDNVRTLSFIVPLIIVLLEYWYISRSSKGKPKSRNGG